MATIRTAVVLGGSISGLCAAGAIAPHADHVVVLERDQLPADAEHRRGVPQSKHPHFLLNSGRRAIGELFPGFEADLIAAGGLPLVASLDTAYLEHQGWTPRKQGALDMVYGSRILIERVLRERVRALANVTIREGVIATGLQSTGGGTRDGRVTGVRVSAPTGPELLDADLVVDALGRGSSVVEWLSDAGWEAPPVRTLDAKVTYVSRWYDLPESQQRDDAWWWRHLVIMPTQDRGDHPAEHEFLANFFPIEGNRSIACMGSWGIEMPKSVDDFEASADRLRTPAFAAAMAACEPTSQVHRTRSTGNVWRRFDRLREPAGGIVSIGDSICAFNPFYAQGMSAASASAVLLRDHLGRAGDLDGAFARRYYAAQRKALAVPWGMAMARDKGYECATGTEVLPGWQRRVLASLTWPMFNLITGASREDAVVDAHFARVFNLDESMGRMLRNPRVLFGLLRFKIKDLLGLGRIPSGFDAQLPPPGDDWTTGSPVPAGLRSVDA